MKKIFFLIITFAAAGLTVAGQVTMQKEDQGIRILDKGENVFFYQTEPRDVDGRYSRRHYIHPLWGPDGAVLTEDFPEDHLHHRGIFWAWHQILIDGQKIGDPWELIDFEQEIKDIEFRARKDGTGVLNTRVNWLSEAWTTMGQKVPYMEETTTVTVYPKQKKVRRIDFDISLRALEKNLLIGGSDDEKGYSGFSVRMVLPDDVQFSGPGGDVEPQVTAVESPGYINVTGSMGRKGKKAGIVIVDNVLNPGHPQPWILRKDNSMQNAAFPGRELIPVSTSHPLTLKYSLLVYSGKMSEKMIKKFVNDL